MAAEAATAGARKIRALRYPGRVAVGNGAGGSPAGTSMIASVALALLARWADWPCQVRFYDPAERIPGIGIWSCSATICAVMGSCSTA